MAGKSYLRISKNTISTIILLFIAAGVDAQFGEPTLITDSPYQPAGFCSDIDGDGDIDVIYADHRNGSINWFQNLGEGNFSAREQITSEWFGRISMLPHDLDGDGDLDIVVWSHNILAWHENLGGGNFSDRQIIPTGTPFYLTTVKIIDFDNDGDEDFLFSDSFHVFVMPKITEGVYGAALPINENDTNLENQILDFAVLDMDNDGLKDIAVSKDTTGMGWYQNLGDYDFEPFQLIDATVEVNQPSNYPDRTMVVYDFDDDGDDDLFYANVNTLWVYENITDGVFEPGLELLTVEITYPVKAPDIEIGNFNDDENLDLFISYYGYPTNVFNDPTPSIYQYEFNGTEFEPIEEMMVDVNFITSIDLHDIDQDGDVDILAFSTGENEVVLFENSDGIYTNESDEISEGLSGITETIAADIDGDFDLDILVASPNDGKLSWYERDETGSFLPQKVILNNINEVDIFLAEDVDQDGDIDLVLSDDTDAGEFWLENNGDGTFTNTHDLASFNSTHASIIFTDFDGDGILDLLYTQSIPNFFILKGQGNGNFSGSQQFGVNEIGEFQDQTIFDVDEDGFQDIVGYFETFEGGNKQIGWYKNDGNGNFNEFFPIAAMDYDAHEFQIEHTDLNQDGLQDLIMRSSPFSSTLPVHVDVLQNLGSGNFSSPVLVEDELSGVRGMGIADLNLDGFPDLILSRVQPQYVTNTGPSEPPINKYIQIYYNDGTGQFLSPELFYAGGSFFDHLSFPDMDSDGDTDMILSSSIVSEIVVIQNQKYSPVRVSGEIFLDENQNGIKDSTETYPNWVDISSTPQAVNFLLTDSGRYLLSFSDYEETYTVAPELPASWGISTEHQSYTFTIGSDFSPLDTLDFGIYPLVELPNFDVELAGGWPRCDRDVPYWITLDNQGTTVGGGTIHLELDNLLDYVDANVEPDSIIDQNIYWHFDSLGSYDGIGIEVTVHMPNFGSIGELMTTTLEAAVTDIGENPYYYADTLNQIMACTYDPNDKQVDPDQEYISNEQDLNYLIRFQNTGTDTAFTVIVSDQLSPYLDWTTIQMVGSSHEMEYSVSNQGELLFTFVDIQLPDSNVNNIGSQGFARFQISTIGDLSPNTAIHNTAKIYFDYNPAIVTNTVTSKIECYIAPEPHISYEFPYLISGVTEGVSYQWYLDGAAVFGATESTFTPQANGIYTVTVWDVNGCSTLSEEYLFESLSVNDRDPLTLDIYPVPSSGAVHFAFSKNLTGNHHLTIYNYQGMAVKQISNLSGSQFVISEGFLSNGFYVAIVTDTQSGQKVFSGKFIIENSQ